MSYKFLAKNGPLLALLGAAIFVAIAIIPIIMGASALEMLPEKQRAYAPEGDIFYVAIYLTIILLVVAVALAVLLSLFKVALNPKAAMKGLIAVALLVVLFLILYSTANGAIPENLTKFDITENIFKVVGAGIALTLILGIGSVALIVVMEFWNYFKNQ
jgi:hypothetical protein